MINVSLSNILDTLLSNVQNYFDSEDFSQVYMDFGEYIIDKQGRWRDPKTGRFISMPDINNPDIKKHIASEIASGRSEEAEQLLSDIQKLKLLNLQTSGAYNATIEKLRRKYRNSPFALSLVSALQLERGVSNKENAVKKIKELEELLADNQQQPKKLRYAVISKELTEIPLSSDKELDEIADKLTSEDDKKAFAVIAKYRKTIEDLNSVLSEINSKTLEEEDYNRLYGTRDNIWQDLKSALDISQDLENAYFNESILDKYINRIKKISRESPGGFKITIPGDKTQIEAKASAGIC